MELSRRDWLRMGLAAIISSCTHKKEPVSWESESLPEPHPTVVELISPEVNQPILESVLELFHPSLHTYVNSIPVIRDNSVRTAAARTSRQFSSSEKSIAILVSPDWDNKAKDSVNWDAYFSKPDYHLKPDDPVFSTDYKMELLAHEYLHLIQDHLRLDPAQFFQQVAKWYHDENVGRPGSVGVYEGKKTGTNRMKYLLWWNLYGQVGNPNDQRDVEWKRMEYPHGDYFGSVPGVEEFAYLGGNIAIEKEEWRRKDRLAELPSEIKAVYNRILNPNLLK